MAWLFNHSDCNATKKDWQVLFGGGFMALVFILLVEFIGRSMKNKMRGDSSISSTDNKVSQFQYFQDNLKTVKALTFFILNWDILLDAILTKRIEENTEASITNSE